jgi:hypothetical protein
VKEGKVESSHCEGSSRSAPHITHHYRRKSLHELNRRRAFVHPNACFWDIQDLVTRPWKNRTKSRFSDRFRHGPDMPIAGAIFIGPTISWSPSSGNLSLS